MQEALLYCVKVWLGLPMEVVESPALESSEATWMWCWAPCFGGPCLSRGLALMASRAPCQPQPCCDAFNAVKLGIVARAGVLH